MDINCYKTGAWGLTVTLYTFLFGKISFENLFNSEKFD